jgi:hypothetical protein
MKKELQRINRLHPWGVAMFFFEEDDEADYENDSLVPFIQATFRTDAPLVRRHTRG